MVKHDDVLVRVSEQCLYVYNRQGEVIRQFPVSTSRYGIGSENGSFKTPVGRHVIREKIGADAPINEVFVGRQARGVLGDLIQQQAELPDDIITTRIMWLDGQEPGLNKGGQVDSYQRYIYIHGTDEEDQIGIPASHGCIRMRNEDVIELFDLVEVGCTVLIEE